MEGFSANNQVSGYTFYGWATDKNSLKKVYNNGATLPEDVQGTIILYALWQRDASFASAPGESLQIAKQYFNPAGNKYTVNPPSAKEKANWTAAGWRTDISAEEAQYAANTAIDGNSTLYYAIYTREVTFTHGRGQTETATNIYNGSGSYNLAAPTPASISGWTTKGWRDDTTASEQEYPSNLVGNTDVGALYAVYSRNVEIKYTIDANTPRVETKQVTQYYNSADNVSNPKFNLITINDPKTNYEFKAWAEDSITGTEYEADTEYTLTLAFNSTTTKNFYSKWQQEAMLLAGQDFNAAIKGTTYNTTDSTIKSITFGKTSDYATQIAGQTAIPVDKDREGIINAYKVGDATNGYDVYVVSDYAIYGNINSSYMFSRFGGINTLNLNDLNTKKITDMSSMFYYYGSAAMTSLDLGDKFDTSSVTDMQYMFSSCGSTAMTSLDLGDKFDTSNVTNMQYMFYYCGRTAMTSLDLGDKFDTSSVTNMQYMFNYCGDTAMTSLDLGDKFDTSKVTNMSNMFSYCGYTAMTSLDLGDRFDTSNVTNMSAMFSHCGFTTMTSLDLGDNFNTSKVTNMNSMFSDCGYKAMTSLDLGDKFDTSSVSGMSGMFSSCGYTTMTSLNLGDKFDTSNVQNMSSMFNSFGYRSMTSLYLGDKFDTSNVRNMQNMFSYCGYTAMTSLDLGDKFDTSKVTNMNSMFRNCSNLVTIYSNDFDITKVTNSTEMFYLCNRLVGGAGTTYSSSKKTATMAHIDGGTSNPGYFTAIPVYLMPGQDFNKAIKGGSSTYSTEDTSIKSITFGKTSEYASVISGKTPIPVDEGAKGKINAYKIGNATNGYEVYILADYDINANSDSNNLFRNFKGLEAIYSTNFKTDSVTQSSNMFTGCTALKGEKGTEYASTNANNVTYAHIDGGTSNPGYISQGPVTLLSGQDFNAAIKGTTFNTQDSTIKSITFGKTSDYATQTAGQTAIPVDKDRTGLINAYKIGNATNGYEVYILSDYDINANSDSNNLFSNFKGLEAIYSTNFKTDSVTQSSNMFTECTALKGDEGTAYASTNANNVTYAHLDGGTSNPGYISQRPVTLLSGYNFNAAIKGTTYSTEDNTIKSIIFGKTSDYATQIAGQTAIPVDVDRVGLINAYKVGDATNGYDVYVVSDYAIYGNSTSSNMFINFKGLINLNLCCLNTSKVTNMSSMFYQCGFRAMTSLDLGDKFDTSNVTGMNSMFSYCGYTAMTSLDLGDKFDTSKVTDMCNMFLSCGYTAMTSLDLGDKFNTSNVTNMWGMFTQCGYTAMTSLDLGNKFNTSNVTNMDSMFASCGYTVMTSLDLGDKFNTSKVTTMYSMFNDCGRTAMTSLDLGDKFNTSKVTNMNGMFAQCGRTAMTSLDLGDKFDTSNVINMSNMFYACGYTAMTSLDLGDKFDTSKVTTMNNMFEACGHTAMTSLDLGDKFDTSEVTNMQDMFRGCAYTKMTSLNLGDKFDTSNVTNMKSMFSNCPNLVTIYSNDFDTTKVTDSTSMFYGCTKLVGGAGTVFNASVDDATMAHIDGGTSNPGYFTAIPAYLMTGQNFNKTLKGGTSTYSTEDTTIKSITFGKTSEYASVISGKTPIPVDEGAKGKINAYKIGNATNGYEVYIVSDYDINANSDSNNLFSNFKGLKAIYSTNFKTDSVTQSSNMFTGCTALKGDEGTEYASTNANNVTYAHLDGGTSNPGYISRRPVTLLSGLDFNAAIKGTTYITEDNTIKSITFGKTSDYATQIAGQTAIPVDKDRTGLINAYKVGDATNGYDVYVVSDYAIYGNNSSSDMFREFRGLTTLSLNGLNTSKVTNMQRMFYYCGYTAMTSLDLGNKFDTSSVNNMSDMFDYCGYTAMTSLDLGNKFDTSNVTNMQSMFFRCGYTAMTSLDLGDKFDTSSVTNMSNMFYSCGYTAMISLDLGDKFDTSNVTNMSYMFSLCGYTEMTSLDLGDKFDTSKVNDMYSMFSNCGYTAMTNLDLGDKFDTSNVTNMKSMFHSCGYNLMTSIDLGDKFDTSSVTDMNSMFYYCGYRAMTNLDLGDKFDTSSVTDMNSMFYYCGYRAMTSLNLGDKFDTSSVTDMKSMFSQCGYTAMTSLDLGDKFDTSSVTDMKGMFSQCGYTAMTNLNLGDKFDTSNVTDMCSTFQFCKVLSSLDLGDKFNTSNVTDMAYMFNGCNNLTTIYSNSFDLSKVTRSYSMFNACSRLIGGAGTIFNSSKTDATMAHIDEGTSNPGYFTSRTTSRLTQAELTALAAQNTATPSDQIAEITGNAITNDNLKGTSKIKAVLTGEVPIPNNSTYKEGTKNTGVVIEYKGSEFVWVPVSQINKMVMCDKHTSGDCDIHINSTGTGLECRTEAHKVSGNYNTEIVGRLYAASKGENFDSSLTTQTYNANSGLREPALVATDKYAAYYKTLLGYDSSADLLATLKSEYRSMALSVAKYGGFYIGRFETSYDGNTVASKQSPVETGTGAIMPMTPETSSGDKWYGMYTKQKAFSRSTLQSSMMWGSQRDAMLNWVLTGTDASHVTATTNADHSTTIKGTGTKATDKMNNIYDLEGNIAEWTNEADGTEGRTLMGGYYRWTASPSYRSTSMLYPPGTSGDFGTRLTLYIK